MNQQTKNQAPRLKDSHDQLRRIVRLHMTKYFCDGCGEELTEENKTSGGTISDTRLGVTVQTNKGNHRLKVELLVSTDGDANKGDYCKYCIIDAFNQLDDRPRAA